MNVSHHWLRALAPTIAEDPRLLAERLTLLGAAVDEVTEQGAELDDVIVARVREVQPHPNADRLRLCVVEDGGDELLQVVCGAPNVEAGRFYPLAPVGARLPGGIKISAAKLRGEKSQGMLCSARELGLGRDAAGLMTLHGEWEPGTPLAEAVGTGDHRLVLDITANRPDLLSHIGVAREAAPAGVADIVLPEFPQPAELGGFVTGERGAEAGGAHVSVSEIDACPRYMAAIIRGISVGPSPEWLASRLRSIGLRPINNVVDATNYVLFELGQPLHAFDLAKLRGNHIDVRHAEAGEQIRTLDGTDRTLSADDLVIADGEGALAIAGVMGGSDSEVSAATRDVLIECALFEPRAVRRTRRRLGLSTDASHRFERGVDPLGLPRALTRVVSLIRSVAGGEAGAGFDVGGAPPVEPQLTLRRSRVERVLGVELSVSQIREAIEPIGFEVAEDGDDLEITVPSWRPDVTREIDLIEEVARRHGYDRFPARLGAWRPQAVPEAPRYKVHERLHDLFARWGFLEAHTPAFANAAAERVPILNPLSQEESHLRDSIAPALAGRVQRNWAHGVRDIRLYEIATIFSPLAGGGQAAEATHVAAAFTGSRAPRSWTAEPEPWDVWDLKALLGEIASEFGWHTSPGEAKIAGVRCLQGPQFRLLGEDGAEVGGAGLADARALDAPPWADAVWLLEAELPASLRAGSPAFRPLPDQPPVGRDLALLLPADVSAGQVEDVVRQRAGESLVRLEPFDLYEGSGLPAGTRSIAWRLEFRARGRTLTDQEVDGVLGRVLASLEDELNVARR